MQDLGLDIDYARTAQQASRQKAWLPVANFFTRHELPLTLKTDQAAYDKKTTELAQLFSQEPADAGIVLQTGTFAIQPDTIGYRLDTGALKTKVAAALATGSSTVTVPVDTQAPQVKQADLQATLQTLKTQQQTAVIFQYQNAREQVVPSEIAGWYARSSGTFTLSDELLRASLTRLATRFGMIGVQNLDQAVAATRAALEQHKPLTFTFTPKVFRTFTYCVQARNVDAGQLPILKAKLAAVYGDARGWSLGGAVSFVYAEGGCNYTVWLSAADQMPTFGSICDSTWSCRSGPNVVINFDRWRLASDAWNQSGGALEDYRVMVINHETGHWLGFGHSNCGGPGQAAPVMQQQSINLQGCKFNPWPTGGELRSLRTTLGF